MVHFDDPVSLVKDEPMNHEHVEALTDEYLTEHPGTANTVTPFVFDDPDVLRDGQGNFPFPPVTEMSLSEDWEPTDRTWFVAMVGFGGGPNEPAMSMDEFRAELIAYLQRHPDHGFCLSGVGQFQVYVTAYRKVR